MAKVTPEGKVKKVVKDMCAERGAYIFMPVQNGMGAPALDFHGVYKSRGFFVETKAPGKKPTARQAQTILRISAAGGRCFVIDGPLGYNALNKWFNEVDASEPMEQYKTAEAVWDAGEEGVQYEPDPA